MKAVRPNKAQMKKPGAPAMAHANSQRINVVPTLFDWTSRASSLATAPGVKFASVQSTRVGKPKGVADVVDRSFSARLDCHYLLQAPDQIDQRTPFVVTLHGFGGNPEGMLKMTHRLFKVPPVIAALQRPFQFFLSAAARETVECASECSIPKRCDYGGVNQLMAPRSGARVEDSHECAEYPCLTREGMTSDS